MKQHITLEQLNELSNKGSKRLEKWSHNMTDYLADQVGEGKYYLPLLSIGQMIEFLDEHLEPTESTWLLEIEDHPSKELCNSLWEAVKEILEK